jgi:SAM-dependent methyltransferase
MGSKHGGDVVDLRGTGRWPKQLPEFTPEQRRVRDQFMARWLNVLPGRYSAIERFNHEYPGRTTEQRGRTLEIGAGLGAHLQYEDVARQEYHASDLRPELVEALRERHPDVHATVADCQARLPFDDGYFDRVLAIHVLEHLPDLPRAVAEIARVLSPNGSFATVIPCEGGLAYWLARRISAQRIFEREFGMPYKWLIRSEHVNVPWEIISELKRRFELVDATYFPLRIPLVSPNLVIGLTLRPR